MNEACKCIYSSSVNGKATDCSDTGSVFALLAAWFSKLLMKWTFIERISEKYLRINI